MKNVLLYGYGTEGRSTHAWLQEHHKDSTVTIYEDSTNAPDWSTFDTIFLSPGVPIEKVPEAFHPRVTNQAQVFLRAFHDRTVGITGTKGKSTTSSLCAKALAAAGYRALLGGNIGVPLLDLWNEATHADFIVAELSSYQLERVTTSPKYAIVTNLMADHLDRYKTKKAYHAAKSNLWRHQKPEDFCFVTHSNEANITTPSTLRTATPIPIEWVPEGSIFSAAHWRENFGLIQALLTHLNHESSPLQRALSTFETLPHRMQTIARGHGFTFVSDTISTTPDSTLAAVRHYGPRLTALILGGQNRSQAFADLLRAIADLAPEVTILAPKTETRPHILKACAGAEVRCVPLETEAEAAQYALKNLPAGVVLLSPAAPSYDNFTNFTARGEAFTQSVKIALASN